MDLVDGDIRECKRCGRMVDKDIEGLCVDCHEYQQEQDRHFAVEKLRELYGLYQENVETETILWSTAEALDQYKTLINAVGKLLEYERRP